MGEVVQFISKAERERIRLIQEARAIYDRVFPPAAPGTEPSDEALTVRATKGRELLP